MIFDARPNRQFRCCLEASGSARKRLDVPKIFVDDFRLCPDSAGKSEGAIARISARVRELPVWIARKGAGVIRVGGHRLPAHAPISGNVSASECRLSAAFMRENGTFCALFRPYAKL
jgi:hypothetical protein